MRTFSTQPTISFPLARGIEAMIQRRNPKGTICLAFIFTSLLAPLIGELSQTQRAMDVPSIVLSFATDF
jgi:hypothetical protein